MSQCLRIRLQYRSTQKVTCPCAFHREVLAPDQLFTKDPTLETIIRITRMSNQRSSMLLRNDVDGKQ